MPTASRHPLGNYDKRPKPDWAQVHRELRRADVTLALLWEEFKAREPDGFGYSWFCDLYKEWAGRLKPTLRQVHVAGEKLFVDYAGRTMEVIDGATGEARTAQIFVAVLGASSYTYAEATFTQSPPDWIGSHARAFAFFGGAARQTVSDNLRSGVARHHWGIENRLHWRLDVVMNEDQDRTRRDNGPQNIAALRHMALNAMQKEGSKGSLRGKFKRAGWSDAFLSSLLAHFCRAIG